MTHSLRFHVLTLPNVPWSELVRRYRHIEELGFDVAGVADHFVDWTNPASPWFEAWTLLAAIARETTRLRVSTLVTQIPVRDPAMLAHQALTVDHISGGRLELGLGVGLTTDPSYAMMGLPNWSAAERVARFKEYVEVVDRLLSNEVTTYRGRFYQVDGAVMNPRPVQEPRPPITIAAMGPVMLKCAARHADTWNSLSFLRDFQAQLDETRERIRLVDAACAAIGRDPASLRRSYLMFDAGARAGGGLINYYASEDVFAEMVQKVIALGISEVGLYYPARDEQRPVFERIARDVVPRLKARHAAAVGGDRRGPSPSS
jgi:alkanesulfonate monooxygenase SsuD/methylene tetrahydromethanopterin reductase-like flavin-dependent oxidoreductase (luciferase family)